MCQADPTSLTWSRLMKSKRSVATRKRANSCGAHQHVVGHLNPCVQLTVVPAQLCISLLYMLNLPSHHASMRDRKLCQVVGMLLLVLQLHLMKAQAVVLHKELTSHSPNIFLIVMYTHGLLHCRRSWHIANVSQ
jgi:hypothetical protein